MVHSWVDVIAWVGSALVLVIILGDVILALFKSESEGTTWSELLRESIGITTFIPWAVAAWVGRWFPFLKSPPLGLAIGLAVTAVVGGTIAIIADVLMRKKGYPVIPPWIVVVIGFAAGALLIPLPQVY
jgi:hypothetical protein